MDSDIEFAIRHLERFESQMRENRGMCLARCEDNVASLARYLRGRLQVERERRVVPSVHERSKLL